MVWRALASTARLIERRLGPFYVYRADGYPDVAVAYRRSEPRDERVERARAAAQVVGGALALIKQYDAARYCRLLRDVRTVVIVRLPLDEIEGWYAPGRGRCFIPAAKVLPKSELALALTIVHEAVHARLDRLRPWQWGRTRRRMEVLAIRGEIGFAARIPEIDAPGVGAWARERWSRNPYGTYVRELAGRVT